MVDLHEISVNNPFMTSSSRVSKIKVEIDIYFQIKVMNLSIKVLLIQLMIKNLLSIIEAGIYAEKDGIRISLNAVSILSVLTTFLMDYAEIQQLYKYILIQGVNILELEVYFYENALISHTLVVVFIVELQLLMQSNQQFFQYFTQITNIYYSLRLLLQFYPSLGAYQIALLFLWLPLNFWLLKGDKPFLHTKLPLSSPDVSQRKIAKNNSLLQHDVRSHPDEEVPPPKLSLSEELLNCLPYGISLLDKEFKVLKCNAKILTYLQVLDLEQIPTAIDRLLSKAEINNQKNSPHMRKSKQPIIPLRQLKQHSLQQKGPDQKGSSVKKNWLSDRMQKRERVISSVRDAKPEYLHLAQMLSEFQVKTQKEMNQSWTNTINSDQTTVLRYQVALDINDKHKSFQLRVYEVDMALQSTSPIYLFILENITNKEKLKLLTSRYKFQQALLNSFSHELRTPLNCSLSLMLALKAQVTPELIEQYVGPAIASSKRLLLQINDILDYAQLDCQDFRLNLTEFVTKDIFDVVLELFGKECSQKQLKLIIDGSNDAHLRSDKDRIIQILVNLINNSIKFTKPGGRIVVSFKRRDGTNIFSVWDNGAGISADNLINLYMPSYQQLGMQDFTPSTKLGIGLKVSQGIAKQLSPGAELQIKSSEGEYTQIQFQVDDPKEEVETNSAKVLSHQDIAQKVYTTKKRNSCTCTQILIVDDVPFNHIALLALLQHYNHKADSSYDGLSAIQRVKFRLGSSCCRFYKIIFMDIEMPGKNGFQTAMEITKLLEPYQGRYVIAMCSAYTGDEHQEQAIRHGMSVTLPKPISMDSLSSLLEKHLG